MKITAVIPAHNAARWLPRCLDSVREQTLAPVQVVVVNDSSVDETEQVLRDAAIDGLTVDTVSYANAAATRNRGAELAEADWIAFLDADDIWYPDHLERASELLEGSNSVGFISHADVFSEAGGEIIRRPCPWPIESPVADLEGRRFVEFCSKAASLHTPSMVLSKERFLEVDGFDPEQKRRHDIDLWLRFIQGCRWAYDPLASLAFCYDTPGSLSRAHVSALHYMYSALKKNELAYRGPAMRQWIRTVACQALLCAYLDEPSALRTRDYRPLERDVSRFQRVLLQAVRMMPSSFRRLRQLKRHMQQDSPAP